MLFWKHSYRHGDMAWSSDVEPFGRFRGLENHWEISVSVFSDPIYCGFPNCHSLEKQTERGTMKTLVSSS